MLLASTSPRRRDLLHGAGVPFAVTSPGIDDAAEEALAAEAQRRGASPREVARRLALAKLLAALPRSQPSQVVLAADTVIEYEGDVLGKARDRQHAGELLRRLAGGEHEVHTGLAAVDARGVLVTGLETSRVRMRAFDDATLETFLETGLWQGKAGAYGVQDPETAPLVEAVRGSDSNVRGLPIAWVLRLLKRTM